MVKILIKKLSKNIKLPNYETNGSSGMDLTANVEKEIILKPGEKQLIPTGIALAMPKGYEIQIRSRSSAALEHGLIILNQPGTIDSDYRGPITLIVWNITNKRLTIEAGTRIAQGVLCPILKAEFIEVKELESTQRGEGGLGSTGDK